MSYVSAFAFYMRAMALGLLIIVGAWSSIHLDGSSYQTQWQLNSLYPLLAPGE